MELVDELPFTDLSVKDNEAFKALILTDDDIYHQSISVKEPHVFKPFLMNKKKWDFEFFNSRQYWANKSLTKEKLRRFINKVEDKNISVDNAQ